MIKREETLKEGYSLQPQPRRNQSNLSLAHKSPSSTTITESRISKGMAHLTECLDKDTAHCYGPNSFKLHSLPVARTGELLGFLGTHSIGKSTALKVLAGELKPNLGRLNNPPDWQEILTHFPHKDIQSYYTLLAEEKLKVVVKPQLVEDLSCYTEPRVRNLIEKYNERGMMKEICDDLELNEFLKGRVSQLSAGVLQRVMIAVAVLQKADVYIFDEPSNFLDVRQRFKAAQLIRSLLTPDSYVIVTDNDISVLDYLSDAIHCFYGIPGQYGTVSVPFNVRAGIEVFLAGFSHGENLRIRDESLIFEAVKKPLRQSGRIRRSLKTYKYPDMTQTCRDYKLEVAAGEFTDSQILVVLGENGTGKTLFIKMLAGLVPPDEVGGLKLRMPTSNVSYKPQKRAWKYDCTVRQLPEMWHLMRYIQPQFVSDVMEPLRIEQLLDRKVASLSSGETQRVAITLCLGRVDASLYLIDEPGTDLDSELRINAAMAIKRHILRMQKAAIIVEHNLIMATYLADQVIVVEGKPGAKCTANPPYPLARGMNRLLSNLNITFSRYEESFDLTPRVNKLGSIDDTKQKAAGEYYNVGLSDW